MAAEVEYAPCSKTDGMTVGPDKESGAPSKKRGFWQRRNNLEKRLIIIISIALLIVLVLFLIVIVLAVKSGQRKNICYTEGCIKAASRLIQGMNQKVSPCEDFFEYACGQWNANHRIPDEDSRTTSFDVLRVEVKKILREELESPVLDTDPGAVAKAKDLYKACVNNTQRESRGTAAVFTYLNRFGGWPVVNRTWDESRFNLMDIMIELKKDNSDCFFWQWVNVDSRDSDTFLTMIGESGLGMPSRGYYFKGRQDPMLLAYETYARTMAILLGADPVHAKDQIKDMVDFEIELANISTPSENERDLSAMYNKMSLQQVQEKFPEFNWIEFMQRAFAIVNITSNVTDPVIVRKPRYLKELFKLLNKTPNRTKANYIVWRRLKSQILDLPERFRKPRNNYNQVLWGSGKERDRWEGCVLYSGKRLGGAVGRIFVEKKFDENGKGLAEDMIKRIRAAFDEFLEETDWMDDVTKAAAKDKADGLQPLVAYPDFIMNDTALDEKYKHVVVHKDRFFETVLENESIRAKNNLKKIQTKYNRKRWSHIYPATVNAFYFPTENQIMFPAGILQPPYFHRDYPSYLNYGGMGMMVGHEITHGFDDEGRQTDKHGNLVSWWDEETLKKFKEKAQCIIDQYDNYEVKEINITLNGINTQGENIADNGGLKEAFRAYRNLVAERGREEPLLPGINLTGDQLFFVNFAQIRCGTSRPESLLMAVRNGRHSPNNFRVIGTVSNMPEFASTYNCPAGSPMNPVKKCRVW